MKKILLLISLFYFPYIYAQTNTWVEYNESFNTDIPFVREALLQVHKDNAIYISKLSTKKQLILDDIVIQNRNKQLGSNSDSSERVIFKNSNTTDKYYLNNIKSGDFYFTGKVGGKEFLIKDGYALNWQISTETKTIANYKTYKATTKFRGRVWEAWFAPDLAYPYGPWKLHSLPGLILEVYDDSKTYNYVATKIYRNEQVINFNENDLPKVSFKKFTELEQEFYDNFFNTPIDSRFQESSKRSESKSQEFDFEWETETK